jgi:hypothetical protein
MTLILERILTTLIKTASNSVRIIRMSDKLALTLRFHRVLSARAKARTAVTPTVTAKLMIGQHRRTEKQTILKLEL